MIDTNNQFQHCERYPDTCTYPCEKYIEYQRDQYKVQEAENIRKTIDWLDREKQKEENINKNERDIHIMHLNVGKLTPEKKQELKELMGKYSGKVSLSEMVMSDTRMGCKCNDITDIDDILEYTVEDPEWLQICNGLRMPNGIIDWRALLDYMVERNLKYCDDLRLCNVCRRNLVLVKESRGEHFGVDCFETVWHCPNGCN